MQSPRALVPVNVDAAVLDAQVPGSADADASAADPTTTAWLGAGPLDFSIPAQRMSPALCSSVRDRIEAEQRRLCEDSAACVYLGARKLALDVLFSLMRRFGLATVRAALVKIGGELLAQRVALGVPGPTREGVSLTADNVIAIVLAARKLCTQPAATTPRNPVLAPLANVRNNPQQQHQSQSPQPAGGPDSARHSSPSVVQQANVAGTPLRPRPSVPPLPLSALRPAATTPTAPTVDGPQPAAVSQSARSAAMDGPRHARTHSPPHSHRQSTSSTSHEPTTATNVPATSATLAPIISSRESARVLAEAGALLHAYKGHGRVEPHMVQPARTPSRAQSPRVAASLLADAFSVAATQRTPRGQQGGAMPGEPSGGLTPGLAQQPSGHQHQHQQGHQHQQPQQQQHDTRGQPLPAPRDVADGAPAHRATPGHTIESRTEDALEVRITLDTSPAVRGDLLPADDMRDAGPHEGLGVRGDQGGAASVSAANTNTRALPAEAVTQGETARVHPTSTPGAHTLPTEGARTRSHSPGDVLSIGGTTESVRGDAHESYGRDPTQRAQVAQEQGPWEDSADARHQQHPLDDRQYLQDHHHRREDHAPPPDILPHARSSSDANEHAPNSSRARPQSRGAASVASSSASSSRRRRHASAGPSVRRGALARTASSAAFPTAGLTFVHTVAAKLRASHVSEVTHSDVIAPHDISAPTETERAVTAGVGARTQQRGSVVRSGSVPPRHGARAPAQPPAQQLARHQQLQLHAQRGLTASSARTPSQHARPLQQPPPPQQQQQRQQQQQQRDTASTLRQRLRSARVGEPVLDDATAARHERTARGGMPRQSRTHDRTRTAVAGRPAIDTHLQGAHARASVGHHAPQHSSGYSQGASAASSRGVSARRPDAARPAATVAAAAAADGAGLGGASRTGAGGRRTGGGAGVGEPPSSEASLQQLRRALVSAYDAMDRRGAVQGDSGRRQQQASTDVRSMRDDGQDRRGGYSGAAAAAGGGARSPWATDRAAAGRAGPVVASSGVASSLLARALSHADRQSSAERAASPTSHVAARMGYGTAGAVVGGRGSSSSSGHSSPQHTPRAAPTHAHAHAPPPAARASAPQAFVSLREQLAARASVAGGGGGPHKRPGQQGAGGGVHRAEGDTRGRGANAGARGRRAAKEEDEEDGEEEEVFTVSLMDELGVE